MLQIIFLVTIDRELVLNKEAFKMKLSNQVYDILKFIAQIVLPAIATFYVTIASIWGLPMGDEISRTVMAIDTLLGAILMISTSQYKKSVDNSESST